MWKALPVHKCRYLSTLPLTYRGLSMTAAASCEKLSGRKKETEKGRTDASEQRGRTKDERDEAKVDRALEGCPRLRFVEERQNRDTTGKDDTTTIYSKIRLLAQASSARCSTSTPRCTTDSWVTPNLWGLEFKFKVASLLLRVHIGTRGNTVP